MKLGVVGLPNVGKSTLFNAITKAGAEAANYPFCTIEPNVGVVPVPDERLDVLAQMHKPDKLTHAVLEFVDIAGLVRGASRGEGLGNQFLSHIREVDAIVHLVRCFEGDVVHVEGSVDPARDIDTIRTELLLADLQSVEKRVARAKKAAKGMDAAAKRELEILEEILKALDEGKSASSLEYGNEDAAFVKSLFLLTRKPVIYCANIGEEAVADADNAYVKAVETAAHAENAEFMTISCKIEEEIAAMDEDERQVFLDELGIGKSGLERLITTGYSLLGLISFLTAGPKEVRAWTVTRGSKAPQAAGRIHSDFERGFIRAEIVAYDDLVACGSAAAAKERGLYRSEGKEYEIKDGDVVLFRFNV